MDEFLVERIRMHHVLLHVCICRYGSSEDVVLPQDCDGGVWYVHDAINFVNEPDITCELVSPNSVSEFIQELVVTQRIAADMKAEALHALVRQ